MHRRETQISIAVRLVLLLLLLLVVPAVTGFSFRSSVGVSSLRMIRHGSHAEASLSAVVSDATMCNLTNGTTTTTTTTTSTNATATATAKPTQEGLDSNEQASQQQQQTQTQTHSLLASSLTPKPRSSDREPSFAEKLVRRCTVFWVAFRVFVDYKWAGYRAKRLKRRLSLSKIDTGSSDKNGDDDDDDGDDHPDVLALWSDVHQRNASRLLTQIKGLAGFWVKVGQYLSTRADIMPPEYLVALAELQDAMPPKPLDEILSTIREELDADALAKIESIDPEPLSTASLAQVHRATLFATEDGDGDGDGDGADTNKAHNGPRQVVLKVQHRGIASLMLQDMENLRVVLGLLARSDPDLDFGPVIREYNKEVRKELDFRTEAENMVEVRRMLLENRATAIIPETVDGLVTERVLVMDFCQGFPVKDTKSMDVHGVDRELLLERICRAWAFQMHVGGLFNADPHGANILVSTAPSNGDASVPVLLDFGLTKRLDPPMKLAFARLMHASHEMDVDGLLTSFDEMGFKRRKNTYYDDPLENMAAMRRGFGDTVPQSLAREAFKQRSADYRRRMEARKTEEEGLLQKGQKRRNPIEAWPSELVFFGRVTNMLRGLCSQLEVRYPYLKTMAETARETIKATVPLSEHATSLVHDNEHTGGSNNNTSKSKSKSKSQLEQRLLEALVEIEKDGHMVGLQLCVLKDGKVLANIAAGTIGVANPRPVTRTTLFNVFSVSKGVLAVCLLRLLQDGRIESLDDPVCKYWPAFATKQDVTVRHLLTHQSGLWDSYPENATLDTLLDWSGMVEFVAKDAKPSHVPGEATRYHALTFAWLVGGLIEAVTNQPYEALLEEIFPRRGEDSGIESSSGSGSSGTNTNGGHRLFLAGISKDVQHERELAVLSIDRRRRGISQHQEEPQPPSNDDEQPRFGREKTETAPHSREEQEANNDKDNDDADDADADDEERDRWKKNPKQMLAKYRGMQHLMNPSVFNMRKVREAKLPSANGHASAESLARFFHAVIRPRDPILTPLVLEEARTPLRMPATSSSSSSLQNDAMLSDSRSLFGLGFQLHEFELANGDTAVSIGHAGFGGSVVLAVPEEQVVIALTVNHLSGDGIARQRLFGIVFGELGWQAPSTLSVVDSNGNSNQTNDEYSR